MMQRFSAAAATALLGAAVSAQQQISPSQVHPVSAQPKSITIDVVTARRVAPGTGQAAATMTIYDNTCAWATAAYYFGVESCEDVYDEGRIPSLAPGTGPSQSLDGFSFAYCTFNAASFQCAIGFWNNLGGPCVGTIPPTPPAIASTADYYFDFSPLGLPGSTATGAQACWIVTLVNIGGCVLADGDGVFDGNPSTDLFTWSFTHKMPTVSPSTQDGVFIAGDPAVGAMGNCTYTNPCTGCGTGLDTEDLVWINVDGGSAVGCPGSFAGSIAGTNCYWFGGYPTNPYASLYLALLGGRSCGACSGSMTNYCTSKISSSGCNPSISWSGLPSLGNPAAFHLSTGNLEAAKNGLTFFGTTGRNGAVFQGGFLCAKAPLYRLRVKNSGGSAPCSGSLSYTLADVLAHPSGGPLVASGATVDAQTWFRDPAAPSATGLSNGLEFTACP